MKFQKLTQEIKNVWSLVSILVGLVAAVLLSLQVSNVEGTLRAVYIAAIAVLASNALVLLYVQVRK